MITPRFIVTISTPSGRTYRYPTWARSSSAAIDEAFVLLEDAGVGAAPVTCSVFRVTP